MKMKVIIIDDEPRAHSILSNYISRTTGLELAGTFLDAPSAKEFLATSRVDLVLLDITMPEIDGFAFLRSLQKPPLVIFTTAHPEFAFESYDFDAVDYLKKPIPFERFSKGIAKAFGIFESGQPQNVPASIELRIDGEMKTIDFSKVNYFQSLGNYIKVITDEKTWFTQVTTGELEESLPRSAFIRIHKSYIVNRAKIEKVGEDELIINGTMLPIGKTFKKYVRDLMR